MSINVTSIEEVRDLDAIMREPPLTAKQRFAVVGLTAYCDGLVTRGLLPEAIEARLRILIVETQNAFNIPTKAERASEPA